MSFASTSLGDYLAAIALVLAGAYARTRDSVLIAGVCFGLATPTGTHVETVEFGALGRERVRASTVDHALGLLLQSLSDNAA